MRSSGLSARIKLPSLPSARTKKYGLPFLGLTFTAYKKPFTRYSSPVLSPFCTLVTLGSPPTDSSAKPSRRQANKTPARVKRCRVVRIVLILYRRSERCDNSSLTRVECFVLIIMLDGKVSFYRGR